MTTLTDLFSKPSTVQHLEHFDRLYQHRQKPQFARYVYSYLARSLLPTCLPPPSKLRQTRWRSNPFQCTPSRQSRSYCQGAAQIERTRFRRWSNREPLLNWLVPHELQRQRPIQQSLRRRHARLSRCCPRAEPETAVRTRPQRCIQLSNLWWTKTTNDWKWMQDNTIACE